MVLKYCFITDLKMATFVSIVHFKVMFYFEDDSISNAMILCSGKSLQKIILIKPFLRLLILHRSNREIPYTLEKSI